MNFLTRQFISPIIISTPFLLYQSIPTLQQSRMEAERQSNPVQKFVDKYFLPHFYHHLKKEHYHHGGKNRNKVCNLCQKIAQAQQAADSEKREMFINQDDIDLLELLDPKLTPETYMKKLLKLHRSQEELRSREQKNQLMQLTLTTRKIINTQQDIQKRGSPLDFTQLVEGIDDREQTRQEELDREHLFKLKEECYLGLGKMIVSKKEITNRFELTKSNYHTRQYLLPRVREEVERLTAQGLQRGQRKFYLIANANSKGISFQVDKMPPLLTHVLEFNKFREIVCTLNEIIQQTVYQHRIQTSKNKRVSPLYIWQWVILLAIVSMLIVNSLTLNSSVVTIISLAVSLCIVMFILMHSCHRFRQQANYVSLIDILNLRITDYLSYLNSRPNAHLFWKTSSHLFWIQITQSDRNE